LLISKNNVTLFKVLGLSAYILLSLTPKTKILAYYNQDTIVFFNGKFIKAAEANVSIYNQTLHYGCGVFEGLRAYDVQGKAQIFKAKEHFERFHYSAENMHLPLPYSIDDLVEISYEVLERNQLKNAYVRPLVFATESMNILPTLDSNICIMAFYWDKLMGNKLLRLKTSRFERPNPKACSVEAKISGHYTNSLIATYEAKAAGYDEALQLDSLGYVASGAGANFFIEKEGKIITAPLGSILNGITRRTVLEICREHNIPTEERFFSLEEAYQAESAFFGGTAVEITGIKSLDDHEFSKNWDDSLGAFIQEKYMAKVYAAAY
jgi:branched-chain amino acid aminotransferase